MNNKFSYLLVAAVLIPVACGEEPADVSDADKSDYRPLVNKVEVMELHRGYFHRQVVSNGTLEALDKAPLKFSSDGVISDVNVSDGEYVRAGTVIASLDKTDLELSLSSAMTSVKKAELELYDILLGQGYAVGDTTGIPERAMSVAKIRSGYSAAADAYRKAELELKKADLISPISGRVSGLTLKKYGRPGNEPLCRIISDATLQVRFPVIESEYKLIEKGLAVDIHPYADGNKCHSGRIVSVDPSVNEKGQISVCAQLKNDGTLIDGMNVKVVVEKNVPDMFVVPRSAVVIRDNMTVLFTFGEDGLAHWVYVNILLSNSDEYAVEGNKDRGSSLKEGDRVIISGNINLADRSEAVLKDK